MHRLLRSLQDGFHSECMLNSILDPSSPAHQESWIPSQSLLHSHQYKNSTIPPATKSCQLAKNKCYYFSLMYLFIALNKVLFSINERVGHLGGKEVNREFRHWRFLACEQALRGALVAGRQKEASDYSSTSFSPRLVQLQRNKIQGLFKDKFQFLRSKIYSIN